MECKFNIGDKVVVVDAKPAGQVQYKNGDVGFVTQIDHVNHGYVTRVDGVKMNVYWDEVEFYKEPSKESAMEQTAERVREDILHIEKRIEEAKKDITSMEEEKNVLIEKLKEKGFEMIGQKPSPTILEVGDRVVITGYSEGYHGRDYTGYEGTLKRVDNSVRPYEVYLDRTRLTHWFRESECKKI